MDDKQLCPDCTETAAVRRLRYLAHGLQVLAERLKDSRHGEAAIAWALGLEAWSVADLMDTDAA